MNPRVIDDMSWAMAEVYGAVTDKLLVNLARHFKYTKTDNGGTFAYLAQKLAELGQVRKESVDIIMQNLTGADDMLRVVLENAISYALMDVEPELKQASAQGMLNPAGMVPELTPNQTRAFKAYYAQSADKLNLVNTVMLESTEAAYQATVSDIVNRVSRSQSLLNIATGEVVSGASSWNSAVRDAVKGMVENGLTGFIDHGGHRWQPETYVAMDVRTTAFNTAREAVMERNESYGNDLYQVSSHNGARPLCYPWQGKIISSADASREVEDLDGNKVHVYAQSETSYGQAAGLFGVNCGHYPIPFIPGFSRLRGSGQSEEDNAKAYAESQEQRKLERKVRKEKLDLDVMKAQGAGVEEIAAQKQRVRNTQADVASFCEQTGRARHRDREYLPKDAKWDTEKGSDSVKSSISGVSYEQNSLTKTASRSTMMQEAGKAAIPEEVQGDYQDFKDLTLGEKELQKLNELQQAAAQTGFEHGAVVVNGNVSDSFSSGSASGVQVPEEYLTMPDVMLLHSHTNDTVLSGSDFAFLLRDNMAGVAVKTRAGEVFKVSLGNGYRPAEDEFVQALDWARREAELSMFSQAREMGWTGEQTFYMVIREQARLLAGRFEWDLEGGMP